MLKVYNNHSIYKLLKTTYISIHDKYLQIINYRYKKSVSNLLKNNKLEQKITNLDNRILNRDSAIYYVIRRENSKIGLLTYVSVFLGHIAYAVEKEYIPVIDMKNFPSIYQDRNNPNLLNVWEFYFRQPCEISLEEIPKTAKIIYSPKLTHPLSPFVNSLFNEKESNFWKILAKRYVRLNKFCEEYYKEEYNSLLNNKRVLGLLYRGTDYTSLKPINHPIQPSIEEFIAQVDIHISEWGEFEYYYIATEDQRMVTALKRRYGDKVITNNRVYYDDSKDYKYLADISFERDNDNFLKGLEYISSIKLLSSTDYIIAGMCAGTYAANFLKPTKFKKSYYFNLGIYK